MVKIIVKLSFLILFLFIILVQLYIEQEQKKYIVFTWRLFQTRDVCTKFDINFFISWLLYQGKHINNLQIS